MYHAHSGWYFRRDNFDVVILRGRDFDKVEEVVRFDGNTWASIVASMCYKGENAETFQDAINFFGKQEKSYEL